MNSIMSPGHYVNPTSETLAGVPKKGARKADDSLAVEFGARLKKARTKLGMTQTKLAALAGVDQSSLSRLESGDRGVDTVRLLAVLKKACEIGISVDALLRGDDVRSAAPTIIAATPELARALERLAAQLQHAPDSSASEAPGPSGKAKKP